MSKPDPLLEPYRLKHLRLRNRLMSTAHEPSYTVDGLPKQRYRLYHAEKAKGGIALTVIGGSAVVSRDSPQAFGNIELWKDECVRWLGELADDVHGHGAAVMIQITHLGRRTGYYKGDWLPVIAPSNVREPAHRSDPKAAEDWDLARVVADYADAAERVKAAGLDGLELEMYGHLLDQFWSPATNKRTDGWGGSLENRTRLSREVLAAVRTRVGPQFVVGVRMVVDEDWDIGLSREEGLQIAQMLKDGGAIDFINVIRGHIDTDEALSHVIPPMGARSSPHLDFAGEVKAATRFPVFHAARIQDVATARHAIASGKLDMVGMTRAHMADPHIALKVLEGREHEIRPCVGMGYCIDRIYGEGEALCIHNPATGREAFIPHVITRCEGRQRKVVVVGAGPGGLEAARVAAARGHEVVVFEAAPEAGGQIRIAKGFKRRREIAGIVDWRLRECERGGVEFRFDRFAEAEDVLAEGADVVVVATGGVPSDRAPAIGYDLVTTSWDILTGSAKIADNVLLYDDNGAHPGMMAAELIAESGGRLEIVSPERTLAPSIGGINYPAYFRAFAKGQVTVTLNWRLQAVRREGNALVASLWSEYGRCVAERSVDQVVVEVGTSPVDELYFALKPLSLNLGEIDHEALTAGKPQSVATNADGGFTLWRIGDAVASRNIHAAIFDAIRLLKDV
jgi:2,4-dienoyl-CoA reductase-like NADH-dependent reductase (Old Yellow Enzyme family)